MVKRVLAAALAVALLLSLAACNDDSAKLPNISTGDSGVLGTDFQKNMNQSTSVDFPFLCETDDGYYFEYDAMVYFIDKESGKSTVLCGKPDCDHIYSETNMGCNAFINSQFLTYYNGKLYYNNGDLVNENGSWVRKGDRLYSMNLDGTSHDAVQNLEFTPKGNTSNFTTSPIIHRGQVYFCYSGALYTAKLGADIEDAALIYGEQKTDDGSLVVDRNILRKHPSIEHIFSELFNVPAKIRMDYFKIKVMELLVFLRALELSEHKDERPYFYSSQIEKIKAIHKLVTENATENYTTEALAKQFDLSVAALKTGFKGVYGSPIYTYIRAHKMNVAASMLVTDRKKRIIEIASAVGYDNPSKFAATFKEIFGMTPAEYRNDRR